MNRIEELTEELLNAIKESDIYKDYLREQYKLQQDPELMERVDRYRTSNFRMQQDASRDHFTLADQVSQELFHGCSFLMRPVTLKSSSTTAVIVTKSVHETAFA